MAWCVVAGLALADRRVIRRAPRGACVAGSEPVTVIVPARNEADNIGAWVRDVLLQSHRPVRIVVADDCSEDATAEAAITAACGDHRVEVCAAGPPPPGWVGKAWAAYSAALRARSEWLLFSDADMRMRPDALAGAVVAAHQSGADALSLTATLECETWWERQIMPAIAALIFSAVPACLIHDDRFPTALLAGGFMLIRAKAYMRAGGHRVVRASIAEDRDLAERLKAFGYRIRLFDGSELVRVRMYRGLAPMWAGWRKNFFEGVYRNPWMAGASVLLSIAMLVLPLPLLVSLGARRLRRPLSKLQRQLAIVCAVSVLSTLVVRLARDRCIGFRTDAMSIIASPIAGGFSAAVMAASAWRILSGRGQSWKGRTIH